MSEANRKQIDGNHYSKYQDLQPWDVWMAWNLNPFQAIILKHLVRYRDKGEALLDLQKAKHYLEKLIEVETERLNCNKPLMVSDPDFISKLETFR